MLTTEHPSFAIHIIYIARKDRIITMQPSRYQKQERGILSYPRGGDKDNNTNETHKKQEYHYCIVVPIVIMNSDECDTLRLIQATLTNNIAMSLCGTVR